MKSTILVAAHHVLEEDRPSLVVLELLLPFARPAQHLPLLDDVLQRLAQQPRQQFRLAVQLPQFGVTTVAGRFEMLERLAEIALLEQLAAGLDGLPQRRRCPLGLLGRGSGLPQPGGEEKDVQPGDQRQCRRSRSQRPRPKRAAGLLTTPAPPRPPRGTAPPPPLPP